MALSKLTQAEQDAMKAYSNHAGIRVIRTSRGPEGGLAGFHLGHVTVGAIWATCSGFLYYCFAVLHSYLLLAISILAWACVSFYTFVLAAGEIRQNRLCRYLVRCGSGVEAIVTSCTKTGSSDGIPSFTIKYVFKIDGGEEISGKYSKLGRPKEAGENILVIYDPSKPTLHLPYTEMRYDVDVQSA